MFEVITMDSKEKRDEMFRQYREMGNENEKQAVKFSDCRPVMSETVSGEILLDGKRRPRYTTTWSIAYPTSTY